MLIGLVCGLAAACLYGSSAVLQAHASRALTGGTWWQILLRAVRTPALVGVVVFDVTGALCQYVAIQRLPLYLAQAAVGCSLIVTGLVSSWLLHERPRRRVWLALAAVCIGLVLLALTAGPAGGRHPHGLILGLYLGAVAVAVLAAPAMLARGRSANTAIALGILAGAAYGGVPLGARELVAPYVTWHNVLIGGALAALGAVAFWCYSLAMQRAPVIVASAPLTVAETVVPSLLGIVLFGDRVRHGWLPGLVVGLLLSVAGAATAAADAEGSTAPAPDRVEA